MILKKTVSAALVAAVCIIAVFSGSACEGSAAPEKKSVAFSYSDGAFKGEKFKGSAEYTDSYFKKKTTRRQSGLALLSMAASAAVYDSQDISALLKDCGFTDHRSTVSDDSGNDMTFDLGRKKVGKKTVVAVILQGTAGTAEWKSNFDLGDGKVHHGFSVTEKAVRKMLNSYIKQEKLKKDRTVFWITGHSRGAAVANLLAKHLSDSYGRSKVFACTFASPKVVKADQSGDMAYNNIFNYVNPDDVVTEVPTSTSEEMVQIIMRLFDTSQILAEGAVAMTGYTGGDYVRYGKDIVMTDREHEAMAEPFYGLTGSQFDATSIACNHCQSSYLAWMNDK